MQNFLPEKESCYAQNLSKTSVKSQYSITSTSGAGWDFRFSTTDIWNGILGLCCSGLARVVTNNKQKKKNSHSVISILLIILFQHVNVFPISYLEHI